MKKIILLICAALFSVASLMAQGPAPGPGGQQGAPDIIKESIGDLTLVAFSGVGGAVLGLSTLSFVDEPSKHLDNIVVGGAIGIIVGVGIVAYIQAVKSTDGYDEAVANDPIDFDTVSRRLWAKASHNRHFRALNESVGWKFTF